jgi:hypothetical protein
MRAYENIRIELKDLICKIYLKYHLFVFFQPKFSIVFCLKAVGLWFSLEIRKVFHNQYKTVTCPS